MTTDGCAAAIEAFREALYRYKVEAFFHYKAGFACPRLDAIENAVTIATAVAFEAGATRADLMPFAKSIEGEISTVIAACGHKLRKAYEQLSAPFANALAYERLSRDYWQMIVNGSGERRAEEWWHEAQQANEAIRDKAPMKRGI